MVLVLLGATAFPVRGARVASGSSAAAISFIDGALIVFTVTVYLAGLAAAFLLGSLRDAAQGRQGLPLVVASAAIIVYNHPSAGDADFIFIPAVFALAWLGGFAFRERDVQAAEARAPERSEARLAAAEERARITRELHDIVAHAVSVMVLQVGAVRHKLPDTLGDDRQALEDVEQHGPYGARGDAASARGDARPGRRGRARAPARSRRTWSRSSSGFAARDFPFSCTWRASRVPCLAALDLSAYRIVQEALTNVLKHAGASRADVLVRHGSGRRFSSRFAMTAAGPRRATTSATGWSASASA